MTASPASVAGERSLLSLPLIQCGFRLPGVWILCLRQIAKQSDQNISEIVREALSEWAAKRSIDLDNG
jgi:hypothetical protein